MKLSTTKLTALFSCLLMTAAFARAQEQPKAPTDSQAKISHLRVDLVLTEYAGEKKVNSLPYTIYVGGSDPAHHLFADPATLRMGVRVPIATGPLNAPSTSYQYQNVGTDIDVQADTIDGATYRLKCTVERTAVSSPNGDAAAEEPRNLATMPVLSNFRSHFEISLHDGETGEGLSATDPFNGHVLKISVTLHVIK